MTVELILGNSNKRFSGVTSTMLQLLPEQQKHMPLAVMGKHHVPDGIPVLSFLQVVKLARSSLPDGRWRVFHARRNDEMIQALVLKYVFRCKLILVFTSTAQRNHSIVTRILMRRMDGILSTCKAAASYLKTPPEKIIPHGIRSDLFTPADDREKHWSELGLPGRYGIGIFGRVRHQKGVDILVDAAVKTLPSFPDFTVVVTGEITPDNKSFVEALKTKIERAGLSERIVFLGKQPFDRIPELFRSMSIVAAVSRNEGFGLTVLEAMSSGAAVLASEAGAWPEVLEGGRFGECVPCDDVDAAAGALEALMRQPSELERIGLQGRAEVEKRYTFAHEAAALCGYFKLKMAEKLNALSS